MVNYMYRNHKGGGDRRVAYPSKIVDAAEVRTWYEEGRTFQWMADEYLRKYNVEIRPTAFSNFRTLKGWPYRYAYDNRQKMIPWKVKREHQGKGADVHLKYLVRHDSGYEIPEERYRAAMHWWQDVDALGLVVDYDPDQGYVLRKRRPGIDKGYIREPARK